MKIKEDVILGLHRLGNLLLDRPDFGINRLMVIAIVIMRPPILPLVSFLHSILVNERNDEKAHVLGKPRAVAAAREDLLQNALDDKVGHHFAAVVTSGQNAAEPGLGIAQPEQLHVAAFAGLAEHGRFQTRPFRQKPVPVGLGIDKAGGKSDVLVVRPKLVAELAGIEPRLVGEKLPALPPIEADGRPPSTTRLS